MLRTVLGIDTSNYKTSVALVDETGQVRCDLQQFLEVKKGERGLRQSVALFQHVNRLPELIRQAFACLTPELTLAGVAVSDRPRPREDSYMPVFLAGLSAARTVAAARGVPLYTFSHQEGHVAAVRQGTPLETAERFLSFHFSGGTSEGLLVEGETIQLVGGSRDLAFGQVLDRVGVAMGFAFPCGAALDVRAVAHGPVPEAENRLPRIRCTDGWLNLSGIETSCQRLLQRQDAPDGNAVCAMLLTRICQAMADQSSQLAAACGAEDLLFAGGVASSQYIRAHLPAALPHLHCWFGAEARSGDNAVGIAYLGGKALWH